MSYTWTFTFKGAAKVLNESEESPFVAVIANTYPSAVKKILKLKIPNVDEEADLVYYSCQEESETDTPEGEKAG